MQYINTVEYGNFIAKLNATEFRENLIEEQMQLTY